MVLKLAAEDVAPLMLEPAEAKVRDAGPGNLVLMPLRSRAVPNLGYVLLTACKPRPSEPVKRR